LHKIQDEFTGKLGRNGKPLSRQYLYQLRRKAEGNCVICRVEAVDGFHCQRHKDYNAVHSREYARKRFGYKTHRKEA